MKENTSLYEHTIDVLKYDTFYRQRFDACPFFMLFIGEAHTSVTNQDKYPYGQDTAYCRFSKNRADWYHSNNQLKRTAEGMLKHLDENENFIEDLKKITEERALIFYNNCVQIKSETVKGLSNDDLKALFVELKKSYLSKLWVSALIDGFALVTDELLHKSIDESLGKIGMKDKMSECFNVLTAPTYISFLQEEDLSLLEKLRLVKTGSISIDVAIRQHQAEYYWIHNNYVDDNILEASYFRDKAEEYLSKDLVVLENEIRLVEGNLNRKLALFEELKLDKKIQKQILLTDALNYLQDERKKSTFWATHYFSIILEEVAQRIGYPVELVKYILPSEFDILVDREIAVSELEQRYNDCMILMHQDEYEVIVDEERIELLNSIARSEDETENVSEIKGMIASLGCVRGKVKIVESVQEIKKVEDGDIIVAVMTRPDYLPAMKKAIAFVTDEGGITCHAAIVAREMKKPCIIGTKIATKVLKDCDMVEVDADNGIIKILRN